MINAITNISANTDFPQGKTSKTYSDRNKKSKKKEVFADSLSIAAEKLNQKIAPEIKKPGTLRPVCSECGQSIPFWQEDGVCSLCGTEF